MNQGAARQISQDDAYGPNDFVRFVAMSFGPDAVQAIERAFGGTRIEIPSSPLEHHKLSKVIGLERARIVAREFGDGQVNVPLGQTSRRARIEQACLDGGTITEIARALGCCTRTVSKARARLRRAGRMS